MRVSLALKLRFDASMDDEHGWNAVGTRLDAVGTRLDSLWVLFLPFNFRGPLLGLGGLPSNNIIRLLSMQRY